MSDFQDGSRRIGYYGAYGNTGDIRPTVVLAKNMAQALARKYDVCHMSRNEYSLLLCDLRNSGVITTQEFSAGYGGTIPHFRPGPPETLPLGENRANFIELLEQYVQYCNEFLDTTTRDRVEQDHVQSLSFTYSRLYALFKQIHDVASEINRETES